MTPDIKLPENPDRLRIWFAARCCRWWLAVLAAAPFAIAIGSLGVMSREVGQSGDWWLASDGGVGSVVIVGVEPSRQLGPAGGF